LISFLKIKESGLTYKEARPPSGGIEQRPRSPRLADEVPPPKVAGKDLAHVPQIIALSESHIRIQWLRN
jgi:hypothetical protein